MKEIVCLFASIRTVIDRRLSRRNGTQKGVNSVEIPARHVPIVRPRHHSQVVISNRVVTCAYGDLELFQCQPLGSPVYIRSEIGGCDGTKIHAASQVSYVINLPVSRNPKRRRKRIVPRLVRRAGMAIVATALSIDDVAA